MNSTALEAILDVFIGMVFMWLILSIATMSIQEWIASYLRWRAKDMETAIRRLLGNDQLWAEQLYVHPLIQGLSKRMGVRPSYIPANKFALALYDIVMTAGTEQSFIQQQLLAAKREIEKAPDQLFPFIAYLFKRFGNSISGILYHISYFFGSNRGTGEQKFEELLKITQKLFSESHLAGSGELQEKLKQFFLAIIDDKTTLVTGKEVSVSSADFLNEYPAFRRSILNLLNIALEHQPDLKLRWAEILVNNDKKLVASAKKELKEGQTLRDKLSEMVLEKAATLNLNQENLELIITSIRQTMDQIDFLPIVNYIQEAIGTTQGMQALKTLNPPLYKSLSQLKEDIIGIANTPQILEEVRTRFAIAAVNLGQEEHKLATMRINTETWFNESMDRLSGWYKRKSTLLAFIIGLVLATILNVDSIGLAQHLWKEPAVREALVANATEFTNENTTLPTVPIEGNQVGSAVDYFNVQFQDLNLPLGWVYEPVAMEQNQACRFLPFGRNVLWGFKDNSTPNENRCLVISNAPVNATEWNLKVMGILFSAFAAAQGSPFWFDILKKVVNIRGSGKSPDEKPK
jgi:hypothetical protein